MADYIDAITSCKKEELLEITKSFLDVVDSMEDAEKFIRALWARSK